ncbi:MAG: DUF4272 domain-containing protein [Flavobacteriales bacterium]
MVYLTDKEKEVLKNKRLKTSVENDFSWYKEDIFILLWCLGSIDYCMPYEVLEEIDISDFYDMILADKKYQDFLKNNKLINEKEIYKICDFYYYISWSLKNKNRYSRIFKKFLNKEKYNISVVLERRKALEWVVDCTLSWDDISLDT